MSADDVIHLVLPLPPRLTNSAKGRSRHWRALENEKKAYWERLDLLRMLRKLPPPPAAPIEHAEATAVLYLWNPMDDDGAMARMKWPMDWLKRSGYIRDDRRKNLRWTGLPDQEIDRKNPRVELEIRRCA